MRTKSLAAVGLLMALLLWALFGADRRHERPPVQVGTPTVPTPGPAKLTGDALLGELFREHRSNVEVEAAAVVERTLADDTQGARHQRFLVRLATGQTLLIAHNLDLARRVPVTRGGHIRFRGEYEWNEHGGLVHWTHRDPAGRHPDGWIECAGKRFD